MIIKQVKINQNMKLKRGVLLASSLLFLTGLLFGQSCPDADFSFSHYCSVASQNVNFAAVNYSSGADYIWNYGDGNTVTINDFNYASHGYASPGTYTVTLTIDPSLSTCPNQTSTLVIEVYDSDVELTPNATTVLVNTPVELSFASVYSSFTPVYKLDIGAGAIVVDPATSPYNWTPTSAGTYTIFVRARYASAGGPPLCDNYDTITVTVVNCPVCSGIGITAPSEICVGNPVAFSGLPSCTSGVTYVWDFGDGVTSDQPVHTYTADGTYLVRLLLTDNLCSGPIPDTSIVITVTNCPNIGCDDCIGSFAPVPGDYMVGTWVKQANGTNLTTYANAGVKISFVGSGIVYGPFIPDPATKIIDGWQRIESPKWTVPVNATQIIIELVNSWSSPVYFDDIRIQPFNSSMKSYVYDPVTLRLAAELDENNYATFYEYDEDGALIRVKKETERGIVTIKETRNNNKKP